jgi:L-serine dehydratase
MGYQPDDVRLRESLEEAERIGFAVQFENTKLRGDHHPNTTRITLTREGRSVTMIGSSIGAGRIIVTAIDGFPVDVTGTYTTLVVVAHDEPGIVAKLATALAEESVNVATMRVSRRQKGGAAIHIYELDSPPGVAALARIRALSAVNTLRVIDRVA